MCLELHGLQKELGRSWLNLLSFKSVQDCKVRTNLFNSVGHILTTLHTPKKIFVLPIDSSKVSFFRADLMGRGFRETILPPRAPEGPLRAPKGPKVRI